MNKHRVVPIIFSASTLALLFTHEVAGQICTFAWNDPVSGLFTDAGRWSTSPGAPQGCQNRAPRPGENVSFRPGTYTVTIPGAQSALITEFDIGQVPADITFALTGTFDVRALATSGQLTVSGPGQLTVLDSYNLGPDASFTIDAAGVTLGRLFASAPGPADLSRQIVVRNKGVLTTVSEAGVFGITVDGGTWHHTGPSNHPPDQITILNSGRFEAGRLELRSTLLRAEGASTVDIGEFASLNRVEIKSGSQMLNRIASLSTECLLDGIGSKWTISEVLLVPSAAKIISTNRAELILREVRFSDAAQFAQLIASGTDSRVRVLTPLKLFEGNATAQDGGIFTVPSVEIAGARQLIVGRGPAGLGGAHFDCAGGMLIGTTNAPGAGSVQVNGGGRAGARLVSIGGSTIQSALTVNASGGTARFDAGERIMVGDHGQGLLRVSAGGLLEFTQSGGSMVVTPQAGSMGEVSIEGPDSILDLKNGGIHVGRAGQGRLNVSGGGKLLASNLNVGDNENTNDAVFTTATITGANSAVRLHEGSVYVGSATLRVNNGGLLQVGSDVIEGSLTMESPAVVDLVSGSVEVGPAGGAPVGILRVDRGLLRGSGTIRCNSVEVIAQGRCQPGEFVASNVLAIQGGNYLQDANGTLVIDVYGTGPSSFGVLQVTRGVTLNGRLVVNFLNGFAPRAGDQLGFIRFGEGLTGSFSSITLNGLAPGVAFEQRLLAPGVYGLVFSADSTEAECDSPEPKIEQVNISVAGEVTLTSSIGACGLHRLEYSEDLAVWRRLQELTADATGRARVTDRRRALYPKLFYRVVRN